MADLEREVQPTGRKTNCVVISSRRPMRRSAPLSLEREREMALNPSVWLSLPAVRINTIWNRYSVYCLSIYHHLHNQNSQIYNAGKTSCLFTSCSLIFNIRELNVGELRWMDLLLAACWDCYSAREVLEKQRSKAMTAFRFSIPQYYQIDFISSTVQQNANHVQNWATIFLYNLLIGYCGRVCIDWLQQI